MFFWDSSLTLSHCAGRKNIIQNPHSVGLESTCSPQTPWPPLAALRWPGYLFPSISLRRSPSSRSSAYIFFSGIFSASSCFNRDMIETSRPLYFAHHLQDVVVYLRVDFLFSGKVHRWLQHPSRPAAAKRNLVAMMWPTLNNCLYKLVKAYDNSYARLILGACRT